MGFPYTKPFLSENYLLCNDSKLYYSSKWQLFLFLHLLETLQINFLLFPPSKYLLSVSTLYSTSFMAIISRRKMKRIKLSWMAYLIVVISSIFIHTAISRELWGYKWYLYLWNCFLFTEESIQTMNDLCLWFKLKIKLSNSYFWTIHLVIWFWFCTFFHIFTLFSLIITSKRQKFPLIHSFCLKNIQWNQSTLLCRDALIFNGNVLQEFE